jgi:Protein of unknown function (DUF1376)
MLSAAEAPSMGELRWVKRDPRLMLAEVADLTPEEGGVYNQVLDLIYVREGAINDDDRSIAKLVRIDIRKWRRIRQLLLDRGKLYPNGPNLRSPIADRAVEDGLKRIRDAAQAGMKSAVKRADNISFLKTFAPK